MGVLRLPDTQNRLKPLHNLVVERLMVSYIDYLLCMDSPVKAKADHSCFADWQRDIMDYPTHLLVLRTPLLIYRHQRRMTSCV